MKTMRHDCVSSIGLLAALLVGTFVLGNPAGSRAQSSPTPSPMAMTAAEHNAHVASATKAGAATPVPVPQVTALKGRAARLQAALEQKRLAAAPPIKMDDKMGAPTPTAPAAMPAGGGMGMMDDKMGAPMPAGGGAMPPAAPAAMPPGGGMGTMGMDMTGSMGAPPPAAPQSTLPGFPGASHLYHIGATGFFLDHASHITLTAEQQAALNKAKEQALLAKTTSDREIAQAEQELWALTAADQPDLAKLEAKLHDIAMLNLNARLAFIKAVGGAASLLTDEQRKSLTGNASPVPAALSGGTMPMPPAASPSPTPDPMATGAMKDM